jgi:hypothetical protein
MQQLQLQQLSKNVDTPHRTVLQTQQCLRPIILEINFALHMGAAVLSALAAV